MKIQEFASLKSFNDRDTTVAVKMYGSTDKTVKEWGIELQGKFNYDFSKPVKQPIQKKVVVKNNSKQKNK